MICLKIMLAQSYFLPVTPQQLIFCYPFAVSFCSLDLMDPLVSVVITSHNRFDYLERAVESVINQTYTNWELFIVDDCSSDPRYLSLKQQQDRRIKYIRLRTNSGTPAIPRNIGIDNFNGEWINFLD